MIVIPSIDLEGGRVVKRVRGVRGTGLRNLGAPAEWLARWERRGARCLHVVDLDAAEGQRSNGPVIAQLLSQARVPVQLGGGLRTEEDVQRILALGARRVLLSTSVWGSPEWAAQAVRTFGDRVGFAMDVFGGRLAVDGWTRPGPRLEEALQTARACGTGWVVYTDVAREGTLAGMNQETLRKIRHEFAGELHVAGGISSREELVALAREGVDGAIVGRALYDGKMPPSVLAEELE